MSPVCTHPAVSGHACFTKLRHNESILLGERARAPPSLTHCRPTAGLSTSDHQGPHGGGAPPPLCSWGIQHSVLWSEGGRLGSSPREQLRRDTPKAQRVPGTQNHGLQAVSKQTPVKRPSPCSQTDGYTSCMALGKLHPSFWGTPRGPVSKASVQSAPRLHPGGQTDCARPTAASFAF